jgi:hypothetical protein
MATGVASFALAPLEGGGVETAEGTLEEVLDAAVGGPRDQAEALVEGAWVGCCLVDEALLICVDVLDNVEED